LLCQESLAPQRHEAFRVQILRVQRPKAHLRSHEDASRVTNHPFIRVAVHFAVPFSPGSSTMPSIVSPLTLPLNSSRPAPAGSANEMFSPFNTVETSLPPLVSSPLNGWSR